MFFKLVLVIILVESGDNPQAVGDYGAAVGPMQIQPILVEDVNRIIGQQRYSLQDRLSYEKSAEMAFIYLSHYGSPTRLGRTPTVRDLMLIWNGGPNFYRYPNAPAALSYIKKAKPFLDRHQLNELDFVRPIQIDNLMRLSLRQKDLGR